jgi:ubiquinone biosynthesis monooxygenase Coq7
MTFETGSRRPAMPGDPSQRDVTHRMIRVDQAGEYGARRIYAGQMAVLGHTRAGPTIRHMAAQEDAHLEAFDRLMVERRVRPTALTLIWHMAGFALGAATALMGERAAMACTTAIEETIDEHYSRQRKTLGSDSSYEDVALLEVIETCHADELEHRDTAYQHGAAEAPGFPLLSGLIKAGARTAIWLSERV